MGPRVGPCVKERRLSCRIHEGFMVLNFSSDMLKEAGRFGELAMNTKTALFLPRNYRVFRLELGCARRDV